MNVTVKRWGNSLAVRLPRAAAEKAGVTEGSTVELEASEGKIVVRPVHHYRLRDLLAKVTRSNVHEEVPTGPRVGREEW